MSKAKTVLVFCTITLVIGVAMIGIGGSFPTPGRPQQSPDLTVHNKTQAFQVIASVRDGEFIQLSLRNAYSQAINAFTLSAAPGSGVQVELTHNDNIISPGATYDYRVLAASLEPAGSSHRRLNLTVLNVMFEDGTGDGDPQAIADIQNRRAGESTALSQILPLLESALRSGDAQTSEGIERLKNKISVVCDGLAKEHQGEVYGGILNSKGYILGEIKDIEEREKHGGTTFTVPNELLRIKERYARKSARLQRILG